MSCTTEIEDSELLTGCADPNAWLMLLNPAKSEINLQKYSDFRTCLNNSLSFVKSVGLVVPNGFSVSTPVITSSGTFTISTSLNGLLRGTGVGLATVAIGNGLNFNGTVLSSTITQYTDSLVYAKAKQIIKGVGSIVITPNDTLQTLTISGGGGVRAVGLDMGVGLTVTGTPVSDIGTFVVRPSIEGIVFANAAGFHSLSLDDSLTLSAGELSVTDNTTNQRVGVSLNTGEVIGYGPTLNFIEGVGVTLGIQQPSPNGTINIMITAAGDGTGGGGSVTSVGLSMPTGFTVTNTPITSAGSLHVTTTLNGLILGNGSGFSALTIGGGFSVTGSTISVDRGVSGKAIFSGDGQTAMFQATHGLGTTPTSVIAFPASRDAEGLKRVEWDSTYIYFYYEIKPQTGTGNVIISWVTDAGIPAGGGGGGGGTLLNLNGLTAGTQFFAKASTGTDFTITSTGTTHVFAIPSASASARGLLTTTDWSNFNSKAPLVNSLVPEIYLPTFVMSGDYFSGLGTSLSPVMPKNLAPLVGGLIPLVYLPPVYFSNIYFVGTGLTAADPIRIVNTAATIADGNKGMITVSSGGTVWNVNAASITYAKIQNVTGVRLLGRYATATGSVQEITLGTTLTLDAATGVLNAVGGGGGGAAGWVDTASTLGTYALRKVAIGQNTEDADYQLVIKQVNGTGAAKFLKFTSSNSTSTIGVTQYEELQIASSNNIQLIANGGLKLFAATAPDFNLEAVNGNLALLAAGDILTNKDLKITSASKGPVVRDRIIPDTYYRIYVSNGTLAIELA